MVSTPSFVLSVAKAESKPVHDEPEKMLIIVKRRYAPLEKELIPAFSPNRGIKIFVDRRLGERRNENRPVSLERRKGDRRKQKEAVLKVVLSA